MYYRRDENSFIVTRKKFFERKKMRKFPCSKQGKHAIPGVSSYRRGPLWLNLVMLLLAGIIVSACSSTASQQKASPQPTKNNTQVGVTMAPQPTPKAGVTM